MWFYPVVATLVVLGIVGGIFGGGIFTIILLPLAAIVLFSGLGYGAIARTMQRRAGANERPLPHRDDRETGHVATSPEGLADARRVQQ
jgi:hypothetical protein